ncbi:hypothetical protein DVH05_009663 [Phytophthora capsici]|nr:hypothetical protein DVH05_009663 [Phytophthora capsici]
MATPDGLIGSTIKHTSTLINKAEGVEDSIVAVALNAFLLLTNFLLCTLNIEQELDDSPSRSSRVTVRCLLRQQRHPPSRSFQMSLTGSPASLRPVRTVTVHVTVLLTGSAAVAR